MSSRRRHAKSNASLYIRNLSLETRTDDIRRIFEKYGPVSDVYLPLDYYTNEPRGFGYVQFDDIRDAEDALKFCDRIVLHGRELDVQFAEGERKTPNQMRGRERRGGGRYSRYRSRSRSPHDDRHYRRRRSYSRSRSPPPKQRERYSRSPSPSRRGGSYKRRPSRSPYRNNRDRRGRSPSPR